MALFLLYFLGVLYFVLCWCGNLVVDWSWLGSCFALSGFVLFCFVLCIVVWWWCVPAVVSNVSDVSRV